MKKHVFALIALAATLAPAAVQAIPAWSRLQGVPCSMCHATPTMQLNKAGLDFLKNGHRTDALKYKEKDQNIDNYFSFLFKARLANDQIDGARTGALNTNKAKTQLELHSFAIYTGGALSDRFSYFAEIYLSENTGATSGSNISQGDAARKKMAEAFLQYNLPLSKNLEAEDPSFISFRVGSIVPRLIHTFGVGARSAEPRALVLNDALPGNSNTYRPFNRQQGVEANLVNKRVDVAVGVTNGADASTTNSLDADKNKDFYGTAMLNLDDYASGVGVIRHQGKFTNYATKQDPSTAILFKNEFNKTGFVGRFVRNNWRLVGTYFMGEETMDAAGKTTNNAGYYGLVDYNFNKKLGAYVRYDRLDPNTDLASNDVSMVVLGINGMLFQSEKTGARWALDYTSKASYQGGAIATVGTTKYTDGRLVAQFTFGF